MRAFTFAAALTLALAGTAQAQTNVIFVPSLAFGTTYDDNLFATPVHNADFMNQLTPSLEASLQSPSLTLQSLYSFDMQRSVKNSALNALEARRHGFFDVSWNTSPRLLLGLGSRYDRSETPGDLNLDT